MEPKDPEKNTVENSTQEHTFSMRWVHLGDQPWDNKGKHHYASTTSDKESGELIHAWLGVRAHTTRWYHAVQKAEKVDEPLRHNSFRSPSSKKS